MSEVDGKASASVANSSAVADADMPLYGAMGMTFMQFPVVTTLSQCDAEVIVRGVPFDMATSGRSGSRFGPQGIRQASVNLVWEGARWPWTFALDDHLAVADSGNVIFKHGEPQTLVDNLEAHISAEITLLHCLFCVLTLKNMARLRWFTLMHTPILILAAVNMTTGLFFTMRYKKGWWILSTLYK